MKNSLHFPDFIKKGSLLHLLIFCFSITGKTQIDSLENVLQQKKFDDTNRVNTMIQMSWEYFNRSEFKSCEEWAGKALELADKVDFNRGKGRSEFLLARAIKEQGNYRSSLKHHLQALKSRKKFTNKRAVADSYNSIGDVYNNLGEYDKALKYFILCLKKFEEINDPMGAAWAYGNIGVVLSNQNDLDGAIENYEKAIEIAREHKNDQAIAWFSNNLGNAHITNENYGKAEDCFNEALEILLRTDGGKNSIAFSYNSLGKIKFMQKKYKEAEALYKKALEIREEIDDLNGVSWSLTDIGDVQLADKNFGGALETFSKALLIAEEIKQPERIRNVYEALATTNYNLGKFEQAYLFHQKFMRIKDSLISSESANIIHEMKEKYNSEKKDAELKLLNREKSLSDLENKNNKIELENRRSQLYFSIAGCASILLIALYIFSRFRSSQKQKKIIETHKEILEEKNHEITQSIQYAQKIQTALLPAEKELKKIFPDSFVLFMPKDIVSGDFFWWSDKGDRFYYATADCTGHGVPGGFMSMLGMSLLNEIVDEGQVTDCGTVLNRMRDKIMHSLKQEGESESKDGMDMVLICIDKKTLRMEFAAANNPILIFDTAGNEMVETPYDKMPVGVFTDSVADFKTYSHQLKKGDRIFTFTDGYADQFGGEKRKKFKYSSMKKLFLESSTLEMVEAKSLIKNKHQQWKGDLEQLDDICIIGIKV